MRDYIDYDEEQFYYTDKNSEKAYTGGVDAVGDLGADIVEGILRFIFRADWVSSALLSLVCYLLTYKHNWGWYVYVTGVVLIFAVSMLLQHAMIVFKILYSMFSCGSIAVLATIIIGYDTTTEMYKILGIAFVIAIIWNVISWIFVISEKKKF